MTCSRSRSAVSPSSPMLDGVRILAVHHDAGRNGATLLFQSGLEGLAKDHGARISTIVPRDGPIVARARALGPVRVTDTAPARRELRARVAQRLRRRFTARGGAAYDLIFANSASSLGMMEAMLRGNETPLAVYVHESAY